MRDEDASWTLTLPRSLPPKAAPTFQAAPPLTEHGGVVLLFSSEAFPLRLCQDRARPLLTPHPEQPRPSLARPCGWEDPLAEVATRRTDLREGSTNLGHPLTVSSLHEAEPRGTAPGAHHPPLAPQGVDAFLGERAKKKTKQ